MTRSISLVLLAATLLGTPAQALPVGADAAPVVSAEHAFAARAAKIGVSASFLEFMADGAIVFAPDPVNARAFYARRPPGKAPKEGGVLLAWWPNFAGLARSGDLGFTTGPATINGGKPGVFYFTVWARQPDGGWKWIYDGGIDADGSRAAGPEAPPVILPAGDAVPLAASKAMIQVKTAEAALAARAQVDAAAAYQAVLTPDARVQGSPAGPATTPKAVGRELATRAAALEFTPLGGAAAQAGELAWTYGDVRWGARRGHYVRIWQRRAGAWKLVFDQIIEVIPPVAANG